MADNGRLFPSLYGGEPGTEEPVDDITGVPLKKGLPPVEQADYPDSRASDLSGHVPSSGAEDGLPADETYAGDRPEAPPRRNRRTAKERISQLTQRARSAEGQNEDLVAEIRRLQSQIKAQESKMSEPMRRPYTSDTPGLYGSGESTPAGGSIDVGSIRQIIKEELTPLREEREAERNAGRLRSAHDESLMAAAEEFPELENPRSEFSQAFRQVWASSPLKSHPDGPLHVAYQVRGILADERAQSTEGEARKRAANVVRSGPEPGIPMPSSSGRNKMKLYNEALTKMRSGQATNDDYVILRKLQRDQNPQFPRR
jgi:hypothetical protein